jgi:hypothetical protein
MMNARKIFLENLKQKEPLRDEDLNVKIILEVIQMLSVCVV